MAQFKVLIAVALAAMGLSAKQLSYSDTGGTVTQPSDLEMSGVALASPAGATLSLACPLTSIFPAGGYYSEWSCAGGTLTVKAANGTTFFTGSFVSGIFGMIRVSRTGPYDYVFNATVSGSLTANGKSTAMVGMISQTLAPLSGMLGTGTIQSGLIDLSQQYEPLYVADTGNNRIVQVADALGSNWISFGKQGSGSGQFSAPWGIAVDESGKIYVTDSGNCRVVRVDNMSGANFTSFGTCGGGNAQFSSPEGLHVDPAGHIYIADTGNNRIVRIDDMTGANFTALGTLGNGTNQFSAPAAVTTDVAGNIYVADNANARVAEFADMNGSNWTVLQFPLNYLTPDGIAVDSQNRIYLTDSLQSQVIRTDNISGANEVTLSANGATSSGLFRNPSGLAVDPDGAIYLADTGNSRALRFFDMTYNDELILGTSGTGVDQFSSPHGVTAELPAKPVAISAVTPATLIFPTEVLGIPSAPESTMLTNIGSAPLNITSIASALPDFSLSDTCGAVLAGGQSCTASVVFQPTTGGLRKSALLFTLSGAANKSVQMGGSGALVSVSPTLLILYDGSSGTVTVTNPLSTSTTLKSVKISGSTFSQKNNCGELLPGASCQITVSYLYQGIPVLGALYVTDSSGTTQIVSITGE